MGYIRLERKILEWGWWKNPNTSRLFIYCLLKANWKEGTFCGEIIPRGSFATSLPNLATGTGLSIQQARTALNNLKSTGELTVKTNNRYSVITVKNYSLYQDDNMQDNIQITGNQQANQQTNNTPTNTNRKSKKEKNKKENNNINKAPKKEKNGVEYFYQDPNLKSAFEGFSEMRKAIKKPLTQHAISLLVDSLNKISPDIDIQVDVLDQSTFKCWQGVFPLRDWFVSRRDKEQRIQDTPFILEDEGQESSLEEFYAAVDSDFGEGNE